MTENDGEMTLPFGLFQPETKLDLIYNLYPHQNISAAVLRITNPMRWKALANTKINLALKDKITTAGIAFGVDNSAPHTRRATRIRERISQGALEVAGIPAPVETFEDYLLKTLSNRRCDSLCFTSADLEYLSSLHHEDKLQAVYKQYNKDILAGKSGIYRTDPVV